MKYKRKIVFLLIGNFFASAVIFLAIELIFGNWLNDDPWKIPYQFNVRRNVSLLYDVDHLYKNSEPITYTRDKYGLRGLCSKGNNLAEIISLGGSTTDQRYLSDSQTWQYLLQHKLSGQYQDICIANAGIDGHSSYGHVKVIERWFPLVPEFKPKFYILYVGINDAGFRFDEVPNFDTRPDRYLVDLINDNSIFYRIYKLLKQQINPKAYAMHGAVIKKKEMYIADQENPKSNDLVIKNASAFKLRLEKIITLVNKKEAKAICVSQPHALTWKFSRKYGIADAFEFNGMKFNGVDYDSSIKAINKILKEVCTSSGNYYIDIYSKQFELGDFYDYVHTTPSGSLKIANYLYPEITKILKKNEFNVTHPLRKYD